MVGRALELLLQGVGYETRVIEDPVVGDPGELLEGVQLLLVTPNPGTQGSFLAGARGRAAVPVLTLSTALGQTLVEETVLVPWPCRVQDLKEEIEAALLLRTSSSMRPGARSPALDAKSVAESR